MIKFPQQPVVVTFELGDFVHVDMQTPRRRGDAGFAGEFMRFEGKTESYAVHEILLIPHPLVSSPCDGEREAAGEMDRRYVFIVRLDARKVKRGLVCCYALTFRAAERTIVLKGECNVA
jgi:hypothetical protein